MYMTLYTSVPRPSVMITHNGGSKIYAGSVLTLTCTITLDRRVEQNEALMVNSTWTAPTNEIIANTTRITVQNLNSAQSTIVFQPLLRSDTGNYT